MLGTHTHIRYIRTLKKTALTWRGSLLPCTRYPQAARTLKAQLASRVKRTIIMVHTDMSLRRGSWGRQQLVLHDRSKRSIRLAEHRRTECALIHRLDLQSASETCMRVQRSRAILLPIDQHPPSITLRRPGSPNQLTFDSVSHKLSSHSSNTSKKSPPLASPAPRATSRCAPRASSAASTSAGMRWYVFTQSRFPQPKTAKRTFASVPAPSRFVSQSTKCAALSAGSPV